MFSSVAKCVATCRCRVSGTEIARRGSHDAILMRLMKEFLLNARLVRMIKRQRHSWDKLWDTSLAGTGKRPLCDPNSEREDGLDLWTCQKPDCIFKNAMTRPKMQIQPTFFADDGAARFVDPREMFSWLAVRKASIKFCTYVNESRPEKEFHVAFFFARKIHSRLTPGSTIRSWVQLIMFLIPPHVWINFVSSEISLFFLRLLVCTSCGDFWFFIYFCA